MELRMPSASANAYLVIAGLVAAGMHGLESSDLPITKPKDPDAVKLPTSLSESLKALKADKYLVDKLGDGFVRWFDLLKSSEIETLAEWTASYSDEKDEKTAVSKAWQKMYMEYL